MPSTKDDAYAARLARLQQVWWKRVLPVQLPYQLNIGVQRLGTTLEVGCGIGRNLQTLPRGSLGIDHNRAAVMLARARGLEVMTVSDFLSSKRAAVGEFDSLLISHVLEHLSRCEARDLIRQYLKFVRPNGSIFIICPQELGFSSDPTHVWFATDALIAELCQEMGLVVVSAYSFPFPRRFGRWFKYNEFCVRARVQS